MCRNLLVASLLTVLLAACGGGGAGTDPGTDEDLPPIVLRDAEEAEPGPAELPGDADEDAPAADARPEATDPGKDAPRDPGHEAIADPGDDPADETVDDPGRQDPGPSDPGVPDPGPTDPGSPDVPCPIVCDEGSTCVNGLCLPCNTDLRCGPTCRPCSGKATHCLENRCVQCLGNVECPLDSFCSDNTCRKCTDVDDPNHCGRLCEVCAGELSACVAGLCSCQAGSCKAGRHCVDSACLPCNVPEACGPTCMQCGGDTPYCVAGARCGACRDDNDCGAGLQCHNDACVPECRPPVEACTTNESGGGAGCGSAIVVGRKDAAATWTTYGDTSYFGNSDDAATGCADGDGAGDQSFTVWLAKGESVNATLIPSSDVNGTYPDLLLKMYSGTACAAGGAQPLSCKDAGGMGSAESLSFAADAAGWYSLVVDGFSSYSGAGPFYLQVAIHSIWQDQCCSP